jgi:hypothetical protein
MLSARMAFEEIVASVEAVMRAATPIRSQLSGPRSLELGALAANFRGAGC